MTRDMSAADIVRDSISACIADGLRTDYNSLSRYQEQLGLLFSAALLSTMVIAAVALRTNWEGATPAGETQLYAAQPVQLSPNVSVIGDMQVIFGSGGLSAALKRGQLEVRGWSASARSDVVLRGAEFLLDGRPVQPLLASPDYRFDLARDFDRLELYHSGWTAILPLNSSSPPREVALQVVTTTGKQIMLRQIALR